MGFFEKVGQLVGRDGVQLELDVPVLIGRDQMTIDGVATVTCEKAQSFKWIEVEFQKEIVDNSYSDRDHDGFNDNTNTPSWHSLTHWKLDEPFAMTAGESRQFPFQLVLRSQPSHAGAIHEEQGGGFALAVGGFLGALGSNSTQRYRIEVKANVEGVAFDPTEQVEVSVE